MHARARGIRAGEGGEVKTGRGIESIAYESLALERETAVGVFSERFATAEDQREKDHGRGEGEGPSGEGGVIDARIRAYRAHQRTFGSE